jgi:hypothetical protein
LTTLDAEPVNMQPAFHKHAVRLLKTPIELRGGTVVVCAKYLAADGAQLVTDNIAYNIFITKRTTSYC